MSNELLLFPILYNYWCYFVHVNVEEFIGIIKIEFNRCWFCFKLLSGILAFLKMTQISNNLDISYLQLTITLTLFSVKELMSLTAVHLYTPAWFLSMYVKFRIDVEPAGRLGPVQVVVQLGLQSAVHVIWLTLPVSVTV